VCACACVCACVCVCVRVCVRVRAYVLVNANFVLSVLFSLILEHAFAGI
jgi:hypothetical protein